MRPYLQAHKRTSMTVQDHIYDQPFKTSQDHTEPYDPTEGHKRASKFTQSQKDMCICHSHTHLVKFTYSELPTQI